MFDPSSPDRRPSAILFDMDGTLTEPMLDFPAIKLQMNIGDRPILEALAAMDPRERSAAEAILHRHERAAAAASVLHAGCTQLLAWLDRQGIKTAVITRNSRQSAQTTFDRHGLKIEVLIAREDGPFKPDPAPLLTACRRLGVDIADAWMVGDGQYDIEAGRSAGARTVWVSGGRRRPFVAEPWRSVRNLVELLEWIREL